MKVENEYSINDTIVQNIINEEKLKSEELFNFNYLEKDKIFLRFWDQMSKADFVRVVDSLVVKKILKIDHSSGLIFYTVNNCEILLNPIYREERLYKIELQDIECIYHLFQEKYNLPTLHIKRSIYKNYSENNPFYQPSKWVCKCGYDYDVQGIRLPSKCSDQSKMSSPNSQVSISFDSGSSVRFLPKSTYVLFKQGIVIILSQTTSFAPKEFTYSIESNSDYSDFELSIKEHHRNLESAGKKSKRFGEIMCEQFLKEYNSKLRRVREPLTPIYFLNVSYMDRSAYDKWVYRTDSVKNLMDSTIRFEGKSRESRLEEAKEEI